MPTYNTTCPDTTQSPGYFPVQANANFNVLEDSINRDHIFNDTPAPGDNSGSHRQVTLTNRLDPSSLPTATNGMIYENASRAFFYNGANYWELSRVFAYATWNNAGTVQGTPFNAGVTAVSGFPGFFDITFSRPLTSTAIQFNLSCIEPSSNPAIGKVFTLSTTTMRVAFLNQNGTAINPLTAGSIIIFGG